MYSRNSKTFESKSEVAIRKSSVSEYNISVVFGKGDIVTGSVNGETNMYKSLKDRNVGNPLTDRTAWEPFSSTVVTFKKWI